MLDIEKMRERRKKLGLTQEQAAERAGLSGKAQWSNIESGTRCDVTMSTLEKIAKALECKPRDLVK